MQFFFFSLNIIFIASSVFYAAAKFLMNKHAINADVTRERGEKRKNGQVSGLLSILRMHKYT
jgi:hypothetical protein